VKDKQVQELSNLTGLTALNLLGCSNLTSEVLLELSSLTALTTLKLSLPGSCAEDAAYVEAVCGLTTLTALRFHAEFDEYGDIVEEVGEWKLDFSRLKTLTSLHLEWCFAVTDKQVQELSNLTRLTSLTINDCRDVSAEGLRALSSLTALTSLDLSWCFNVRNEVLRALSSLTALSTLNLKHCPCVTAEAKQALRTAIPNLTIEDD
jgi:F-box/leucine-rich repeat protein 14